MTCTHIFRHHFPRTVRFIAFVLISLVVCVFAVSAKADDARLPPIAGHAAMLLDADAAFTLGDVLSPEIQAGFQAIKNDHINLSYTRSALWVKLVLPGSTDMWADLTLTPNFLDFVDVYVASPGRGGAEADFVRSVLVSTQN